jgi:hypothetical protein
VGRNWIRKIQAVLGGRSFTLDGFDMSFKCEFGASETPNTVELSIANLAPGTINAHAAAGGRIILNAGYEGDVGNIASGYVAEVSTSWSGTNKTTTVVGLDASADYMGQTVSKAYAPGTTASQILADLASMTGLAMGDAQLKTDAQYTRGLSVSGRLRDVLKGIVERDCETNMQILNGAIVIRPIGAGLATGFVLSPQTGLIGSPEPVSGDAGGEGEKADYKVRCLLNYRIGCMSRIRIKSRLLDAEAVVLRGTHSGSRRGPFETEAEVRLA